MILASQTCQLGQACQHGDGLTLKCRAAEADPQKAAWFAALPAYEQPSKLQYTTLRVHICDFMLNVNEQQHPELS
jgi:hypothetical protein